MTDKLDHHIEVLARWFLQGAFEAWAEDGHWEDYPEIGLYDFERIVERAEQLATPSVGLQEFEKSYVWMAARAEGTE